MELAFSNIKEADLQCQEFAVSAGDQVHLSLYAMLFEAYQECYSVQNYLKTMLIDKDSCEFLHQI